MKIVALLMVGGLFLVVFLASVAIPGNAGKARTAALADSVGGANNAMLLLGFGVVALILLAVTLAGC